MSDRTETALGSAFLHLLLAGFLVIVLRGWYLEDKHRAWLLKCYEGCKKINVHIDEIPCTCVRPEE